MDPRADGRMWLMSAERIVIGLKGEDDGGVLVQRAARLLPRGSEGLLAVHVRTPRASRGRSPQGLESQRRAVAELGGSYRTAEAADVATGLLDFARSVQATQIVVGQSRRGWFASLAGNTVEARVVRGAVDCDVHVVAHGHPPHHQDRPPLDVGRARTGVGFALAAVLPVGLQWLLAVSEHSVATAVLVQLAGAVAVALVGGLWPALLGALWSSVLVNYFSTPPLGNLAVEDPQDFLSLAVFVGLSVAVAGVVDRSARRSREAARARAEAAILGDLALDASRSADPLAGLLADAMSIYGASGAALLAWTGTNPTDEAGRTDESDLTDAADSIAEGPGQPSRAELLASVGSTAGWQDAAAAADQPAPAGMSIEPVDAATVLVLFGKVVPPEGRRLLGAVAVHAKAQLERRQLEASRHQVMRLAEGNTMRTAILRAVSHDLRTPLAGIKLAAGALLQESANFSQAEERELLETIDECSDRLDQLVANLLDMSRITAQSVDPLLGPVRWNDVLDRSLGGLPRTSVSIAVPANMPAVEADPGLLERVIANIVENALKYATDSGVTITGSSDGMGAALAGRPSGELRIVDHGPGVPARKMVELFRPFQRLNDQQPATGVGLGLSVAQGFVTAMRGTLTAEETPGGGLTMVIRLPLSTGVNGGPK
ncbi:Sensor protein KdpD [Arthrobacter ulcerisalmonis]|uniref:histidine kinase n=2 Tax=Arthrobacter ulcerisalmonis TaxID=2483813 RepID=A0A3P5X9T4_9MICC|nr:Sensor protein KdpD [Arthrobacter ulcerisalmonis]